MPTSFAILGSGFALTTLLIGLTIHYWQRTLGEENAEARRELGAWALKGLATPILFLIAWNSLVLLGVLHQVVPLMPGALINTRQYVQAGPFFAIGIGVALLLTSSFWSAIALARLLPRLPFEDLRADLKVWLTVYCLFILPPAGLLIWWAGPGAAGFSAIILMVPLLQVLGRPKPKPFLSYARAVGRAKLGKYTEAEAAVIEELDKCADDIEGWMMLATLYAENFHELEPAEATIRELIEQPNLTPFHISQALNRLADWQLKLGDDPQAARRSLKELIARCEGTPFARSAEHRLAQLPLDREELQAQRAPKKIRLPSLSEGIMESQPTERGSDRREEARKEIERLHLRLGIEPGNPALLERIAVLQAEEFGEAAPALKAIEALLARPDRPADKVPVWLSQLASWQLKFRQDEPAAKKLLERLVREFPGTPQAFGASAQLWALEQRQLAATAPTANVSPPRIVVKLPESPAPG